MNPISNLFQNKEQLHLHDSVHNQELTQPNVSEAENGYLVPNIDLTPLCSPKFRPGMTNDDAQVCSAIVDDLIRSSKWIDPQQLCICKEKLVWVLYCDITCLDFDGGILDTSIVALCAALRCCEFNHRLIHFDLS